MRLHQLLIISATLVMFACNPKPQVAPVIDKDAAIERKVEDLLSKMTLDEKIGQMTQLSIDVMWDREARRAGTFKFDEAILDSVIVKYKVGSILNIPGVAQTPERWNEIISVLQQKSIGATGIPCLYGLDQNHGASYTMGAIMFPQPINMAASFNRDLVHEAAVITAYETRASSVPWTFNPTLDLGRDPRWSRLWENYGEDAFVNAEMGRVATLGMQGKDPNHVGRENIAVCVKHYMGYGVPVSGKDRTPAIISPSDLRDKHFAPYLASIQAGALSIMVNSGSVNGVPVHANYQLLTQWLKEELNWDGLIVTDWADINNLFNREKVAANKKEAIKMAINAGIDMSMDPYSWDFCVLLKELVEEGQVSMERIDDAARRVLRLKFRLGLFEESLHDPKSYPLFGSTEHYNVAVKAAEESMILLKNKDNILPLTKGTKILVTGPNANSMRTLNGGWTYTWQGERTDIFTGEYNTLLEGLAAKFGAGNIIYEPGVTYKDGANWWEENTPEIDKAVSAAAKADVIVVCVGENSYCETPGNLTDLTMSANQRELVKALAKTGKPIVLVLNQGRPRIIKDIEPLASAIVYTLLPGNAGGDAFANLISGEANFSGKLPFTYPLEVNSLTTYDYKVSEESDTMEGAYNYNASRSLQWPFGYGLSYTTFRYGDLKVNKENFTADDELVFEVEVTNTGKVKGKEAVLLYSTDLVASIVPDARRLRAFEKVELEPGQTRTVKLALKGKDLAFVGFDGKWILEEGDFEINVGDKKLTLRCTKTKKWDTPNR